MTAYTKKEWETFATAFFIAATVTISVFTLGMYCGMYVMRPKIDDQSRTGFGYHQPRN